MKGADCVKELLTMWKSTRMIVLVAIIAAVYAAVLIPFKAIPLVPGFTEVRVAQVIPPVVSLMFGPAAAWGIAIGNLIGDLFGTFGLGSLFGFVGNFFLGLIPYLLWGRLGPLSSGEEPTMRGGKQVVEFVLVTAVSGVACAAVIAWGLEVLNIFPFALLGSIIAINNVVLPAILGPIVLALLYRRVKAWGLLWTDIMDPEDIGSGGGGLGAALGLFGAVGGWIVGMLVSVGLGAKLGNPGFALAGEQSLKQQPTILYGVGVFMLLLVLSLYLGRARTDLGGSGKQAA